MKKRNAIICIFVFIILISAFGIKHTFQIIEKENTPYLSNKEQFADLLYSNKELFETIVIEAKSKNNINLQYNSNMGIEQVYSQIGMSQLSNSIWDLMNQYKITNFQKTTNDYFLIYQYPPIVYSDLKIGVKYNYKKRTWEYYYQHDYKNCHHKHKILYKLYDVMFNSPDLNM